MNKLHTIALGGVLAASISSAFAEPSRTFFTETADVAANGSVSLDLEYIFADTAGGTGVRIGGMGGEILLNNRNTPAGGTDEFLSTSIGYKKAMQKNLAAYGILSYINDDTLAEAYTDFALGVAYTQPMDKIRININGEILTDDSKFLRGETVIFVKGAIQFDIDNLLANSSLIAEVALEDSDFLETAMTLGMRWQPSKRVTTDFIIYADDGNPAGDKVTGIPGYIKLNIAF